MAKLGLALSGGGFRASLFHIGVLARLAELDLLRSVEVLSCVSGGSIVGAFYYLHLKRLLESRPESRVTRDDYIGMVRQIEADFLSGVQKNLRVRAFSNFWKNWKMFAERYSRSDRMAELYDMHFFNGVASRPSVPLRELKIQPPDAPSPFHPRLHNRKRRAKVPMLIINATTLNTGRNWQFTAVDMGEREPDQRYTAFEKNSVLHAFRFDAPSLPHEKYRGVPLSIAVAASACVPGIFQPLALTGLYPDVVPQLVDGGVEDNQGITTILYEQCSHIIASDASTQLSDVARPSSGIPGVITRTNGILMDRVRDHGLESLVLDQAAEAIVDAAILHLRADLDPGRLSPGARFVSRSEGSSGKTVYGIDKQIQRLLAGIRTDLDSFSDIEANSLMYSGYKIATNGIQPDFMKPFVRPKAGKKIRRTGSGQVDAIPWPFAAVKELAEEGTDNGYRSQLTVARSTFFKAYSLKPSLIPLGVLILLVSIAAPIIPLFLIWKYLLGSSWAVVEWSVVLLMVTTVLAWLPALSSQRHRWWSLIPKAVAMASIALVGSLLFFLHLRWIDPVFIRCGKIPGSGK